MTTDASVGKPLHHDKRWKRRLSQPVGYRGYHRFDGNGSRIHSDVTFKPRRKGNWAHWTWISIDPGRGNVNGVAVSFWAALRAANASHDRMDAASRLGGYG